MRRPFKRQTRSVLNCLASEIKDRWAADPHRRPEGSDDHHTDGWH
jgi:hypothetical protein